MRRRNLVCFVGGEYASHERLEPERRVEGETVTDQERQKAEELVSRLELSLGQIFPRDGGNASIITSMIQTLNGLRSLLGIVRPH
jgi:hypothetical protein